MPFSAACPHLLLSGQGLAGSFKQLCAACQKSIGVSVEQIISTTVSPHYTSQTRNVTAIHQGFWQCRAAGDGMAVDIDRAILQELLVLLSGDAPTDTHATAETCSQGPPAPVYGLGAEHR